MAIFSKSDRTKSDRTKSDQTKFDQSAEIKTESTIISTNTRINGRVRSSCPLQINGALEGTIETQNTVTIGRSGNIEGELRASRLTVTGIFHGTADCERVDIRAGGNFRGKVITDNLTIDQNCNFEGESVKKTASIEAAKAAAKKSRRTEPITSLPDSLHAS